MPLYQIQTNSEYFLWIAASVVDAPAVNSNGIKTLLANCLSTFFIKWNSVLINGHKTLPKNSPDFPILCKWVFDNFILGEDHLQNLYEAWKLV